MRTYLLFLLKALVVAGLVLAPYPGQAQVRNKAVTEQSLNETICSPGWSSFVRPPTSYTNRIKKRKFNARTQEQIDQDAAVLGRPPVIADYELDHIWPISSGGDPRDPSNLGLQLWEGPAGAKAKDKVEARTHAMICKRTMTLEQAGACYMGKWQACAKTP